MIGVLQQRSQLRLRQRVCGATRNPTSACNGGMLTPGISLLAWRFGVSRSLNYRAIIRHAITGSPYGEAQYYLAVVAAHLTVYTAQCAVYTVLRKACYLLNASACGADDAGELHPRQGGRHGSPDTLGSCPRTSTTWPDCHRHLPMQGCAWQHGQGTNDREK